MPQAAWIILKHVRKALAALYGREWAQGISTHYVGGWDQTIPALTMWERVAGESSHYVRDFERGISAINMWENRDRVCQHSLGRRIGTGDKSTYLAEWLGQGISALCGRMGAKDISTHYVGGCRQGISTLTIWRMGPRNICSHLVGGYELAISVFTMWEERTEVISTL